MSITELLVSAFILFGAASTFGCSFNKFQRYFRDRCKGTIEERQILSISMRCVSAVQGVACCISGIIIINSCDDLVHDNHWLTNTYVLIGTGYLVYDCWASYVCFLADNPEVQDLPLYSGIAKFMKRDPAMMFHHVGLPFVYLPTVMYYRGGVGDGLIGCFMMIEATVPFISIREILVLLNMSQTWLYFINGVFTLIVYTASRILIFPWMFWLYGKQINRPWYEVPFLLKRVCIGGTAAFVILYVYWWFMIMNIAREELKVWFGLKNKDPNTAQDNGLHRENVQSAANEQRKSVADISWENHQSKKDD